MIPFGMFVLTLFLACIVVIYGTVGDKRTYNEWRDDFEFKKFIKEQNDKKLFCSYCKTFGNIKSEQYDEGFSKGIKRHCFNCNTDWIIKN